MKETMTVQAVGDREIVIWNKDDGWWSCVTGQHQGIWSESDDFGPYASVELATQAAADYIRELDAEEEA